VERKDSSQGHKQTHDIRDVVMMAEAKDAENERRRKETKKK